MVCTRPGAGGVCTRPGGTNGSWKTIAMSLAFFLGFITFGLVMDHYRAEEIKNAVQSGKALEMTCYETGRKATLINGVKFSARDGRLDGDYLVAPNGKKYRLYNCRLP